MAGKDPNGWSEYEKLVLSKLDDHQEWLVDIQKNVSRMKTEIALLKLQSGMWGALAGAIPAVGILAFLAIKGLL